MFLFILITGISVTSALESRVFNGFDLRPEVHGYLVELKLKTASYRSLCSGSIINAKWILSSAHCFPCNTEFTVTVQQKTAKGEVKILGKVIPVNIIKHSAYIENDESIENRLHDIALIKTSKPIRFDEFTWPIELAKLPPKIGQSVIIAGYGDTELRQKLPREGAVEVSECPYEVDDLVCSWHKIRAGGGDSGGALTSRGRLVGITSASCPGAHVEEIDKCITVYTSVTVHLQWIMARIS
ncbi:snake venom serine protease Dav-PA-like [Choristoneura fumiferana]|uniref:snake venom serine protease Dav-PA-like n=1 Tax=Choristoneura fumiferana TaxID=7141 RepID=UPI003D1586DB